MIKIVGVGDIMPGGLLTDSQNPCVNDEVLKLLLQGDVRCGTLECAFGNEPTYDEAKVADRGNVIYAKDADIRRLKELHVDIVSLANNHFFDLGAEGALHTIELLDKEGIQHCGAGRNLEEAGRPVVKEIQGKTVAFLGFCDTNYNHVFMCTYATENSPGVNPMRKKYVESEIRKYAELYDYVVVLAHWGVENVFCPSPSTVKMGDLMLAAGACLVLGSHPHSIQPVVNKRNKSIVYSMGNFLFPDRLIAPPKVTYYPTTPIDYSTLPVTDKYPLVDCVTLKILPYWARVGQIVESQLNKDSAVSNYRFTYLNKDNCLTLLNEKKSGEAEKKIKALSWLLKRGLYSTYITVHGKLSKFLRK